jgi:HK97 family phage prohead protease
MNLADQLERKYCVLSEQIEIGADATIAGYASLFGEADQGNDVVMKGAYAASLDKLKSAGTRVKFLWQHDPTQPIGVWDEVYEDAKGLYVKGRLLTETQKGSEAAALIAAGAIDGLSIGYRTVKADRDAKGRRQLAELELWEVSLVTFPMLPEARIGAKADTAPSPDLAQDLAGVLRTLRHTLAE